MWNLKKNYTKAFIYKTQTFTHLENKLTVTKGERGVGRNRLGVWD